MLRISLCEILPSEEMIRANSIIRASKTDIIPSGNIPYNAVLPREFCSAYEVSHGETLRNVTNPLPFGNVIRFNTRVPIKKDHHKDGLFLLVLPRELESRTL